MTTSEMRATMRLQMHRDFDFADAIRQLGYFSDLGISHLYLSPILTARSGSTHGYDVVDYGAVNPELGGEEGLVALVEAARRHRLGIIVDIVPNHMAVGHHDNPIWLDVLEWGRGSRYANFFDIDWDVRERSLHNKALLPFLGDQYGEVLDSGELQLCLEPVTGRFYIAYFEHHFPINPVMYPSLLRLGGEPAAGFAERTSAALRGRTASRHAGFEQCRLAMAAARRTDPVLAGALQRILDHFAENPAALHRLLEHQHYRLAWWRTAADEINWRRFFDVTDLAGVRIQEPAVFEIVHGTIFRLYAQGLIDGVRIDHIDGLADPRAYCRRLRRRLNRLNNERPIEAPRHRPLIYVEKILAPGERLAADWQVDGTTGYSFMNAVSALLHWSEGEAALTALWERVSPRKQSFEEVEREARRRIPHELLGADFNACAHALHQVAWTDSRTRDWSILAIRRVLAEILVQFPVYRTYADARGRSEADEQLMRGTMAAASPHCRPADRPLLTQIDRWLGGEPPRSVAGAARRRARLRAIARFQQLSSPVAAKAVEDTAFYRHGRLLSRNEVGADPGQFALPSEAFDRDSRERLARYPRALLATATHDHKRGEDLRMRLAALSEHADSWTSQVEIWRQRHQPLRARSDGTMASPDPVDEYMLYQMLFGAWPLSLEPDASGDLTQFRDRIGAWQRKAIREAKRLSGWIEPNLEYEAGAEQFLAALLDPAQSALFLTELHRLVESIAPTGALNSLAQTLIKMTAPGIPDFYQGTEFWDFSLVDPDNRRAVDYEQRKAALDINIRSKLLLEHWRDGHLKQQLIARTLRLRKQIPLPFERGSYVPLTLEGAQAGRVFGYLREYRKEVAIIVVPRFAAPLVGEFPMVPPLAWQDTRIRLPARFSKYRWYDALGRTAPSHGRGLRLEQLLNNFPVGLWYSRRDSD